MSEISVWQVTKNPPWSVKQNVLAHVTKKAEGICGFRWHSHPVLSCLLAWFFSLMNSQVILRYAHSYKMGCQQSTWLYPSSVRCACACDTHSCSTFPTKFARALILSILKPEGKDNPFSATDVRLRCSELWSPSCDHGRNKLTVEYGGHESLKDGQEPGLWVM